MTPDDVRNVADLKRYLTELGRSPDAIGYADDREQRRGSGELLLRELPDGRWESYTDERGTRSHERVWASEAEAVRTIATEYASQRPPSRLGDAERRHLDETRDAHRAEMESRVYASELREALLSAGRDPGSAVIGPAPTPDAPPPPEGPWVLILLEDGSWVIGGMSRGDFRSYAEGLSIEQAVGLAVRLTEPSRAQLTLEDVDEELVARGWRTAAAIVERTRERHGAAGPSEVGPGELLDVVGADSGHHVFALGTPFAQRSQPPSMIGQVYHRYEVLQMLPNAREGVAAAWFDQEGGGAMLALERPIRWHVDEGYLRELF